MVRFTEKQFVAPDGLQIYYRDYDDAQSKAVPVLCLAGLTRNSRDFAALATRLSTGRRVICMDYRGRGRSGYDTNPQHYVPPTYVSDVLGLLAATGLQQVVVIGTSLGGIIAMALAAAAPAMLAGVVLNDIGPVLMESGRVRIATYVGEDVRCASYAEAGARLRAQFHGAYPDLTTDQWTDFARNLFVEDAERGNLRLDYDLALAIPLKEQATQPVPDLWPLFAALGSIPTLAIRGALSDVLAADTFDRMAAEKPDLIRVTVPNRGHVPLLDEPECVRAINTFLAGI